MNRKLAWVIAGAWVSLYGAGKWAGKHFSHDWKDTAKVKSWTAPRLDYRADTLDAKPSGIFSFRCGPDTFSYRLGSPIPQIENATGVWQRGDLERKWITVEDAEMLLNALNIPVLAKAPELIVLLKTMESKNYAAAMIVGGLAGFGLGFYLNFKPAPSCPEIKTALQEPEFWRSLEDPTPRNLYTKGVVVHLTPEQASMLRTGR
jgi:hypothetical protein